MTSSLGKAIAGLYPGALGEADVPLPHAPPQQVPSRLGAQYGPAFWLPWSNWRDRMKNRGPVA